MNLMRRMENIEPYVPPGFRFHPTDEELVGYYLKKKVASEKIDLNVIKDVDLYRIEPWDIQELCKIGYEEEREWYFFSHKDKKYPTGTRMNRATMAGFWKATGRDKAVYQHSKLIGMRKTLVFYIGRAPNGHKTDWIMHEYRLDTDFNSLPQEEGWVVCRAFKKRNSCQARSIGNWNPCYIDEGCNDPSILGSSGNLLTQPQTLISKQDITLDLNDILPSEYIQLPQLENPHHSLSKKPRWVHKETERKEETEIENRNKNTAKVADWRVLDRFVASQLSPGEEEEEKWGEEWLSDAASLNHSSDFAFFLLQNELGGGGKMNIFHKQETQS